jgi:hypothetical protein
MFIICKINVIDNSVNIIDVFKDEIDAINHLHKCLGTLSNEAAIDILIVSPNRIEVYHRSYGYIYNSKDLLYVYEIRDHKDA